MCPRVSPCVPLSVAPGVQALVLTAQGHIVLLGNQQMFSLSIADFQEPGVSCCELGLGPWEGEVNPARFPSLSWEKKRGSDRAAQCSRYLPLLNGSAFNPPRAGGLEGQPAMHTVWRGPDADPEAGPACERQEGPSHSWSLWAEARREVDGAGIEGPARLSLHQAPGSCIPVGKYREQVSA